MITFLVYMLSLAIAFVLGRWSAPKVPKYRVRHIKGSDTWTPTEEDLEILSSLFED